MFSNFSDYASKNRNAFEPGVYSVCGTYAKENGEDEWFNIVISGAFRSCDIIPAINNAIKEILGKEYDVAFSIFNELVCGNSLSVRK